MTTIATDGKSMAADGRGCIHDTIAGDRGQKIYRLKDNSLFSLSGATYAADLFVEWLDEGADPSKFPENMGEYGAIHLLTDGEAHYYNQDSKRAWRLVDCPFAVGSGREFAMGAMMAGASPAQAVRIAATRDPFTGGIVTSYTLSGKKNVPKSK
jgi:hypothetical protein